MIKQLLDVILFYMILAGVAYSHWFTNRAIKETRERRARQASRLDPDQGMR